MVRDKNTVVLLWDGPTFVSYRLTLGLCPATGVEVVAGSNGWSEFGLPLRDEPNDNVASILINAGEVVKCENILLGASGVNNTKVVALNEIPTLVTEALVFEVMVEETLCTVRDNKTVVLWDSPTFFAPLLTSELCLATRVVVVAVSNNWPEFDLPLKDKSVGNVATFLIDVGEMVNLADSLTADDPFVTEKLVVIPVEIIMQKRGEELFTLVCY